MAVGSAALRCSSRVSGLGRLRRAPLPLLRGSGVVQALCKAGASPLGHRRDRWTARRRRVIRHQRTCALHAKGCKRDKQHRVGRHHSRTAYRAPRLEALPRSASVRKRSRVAHGQGAVINSKCTQARRTSQHEICSRDATQGTPPALSTGQDAGARVASITESDCPLAHRGQTLRMDGSFGCYCRARWLSCAAHSVNLQRSLRTRRRTGL